MSDAPVVMKWFTRVRRIPTLIGKMPSGERIWGGPYRASQLVAFGCVLVASLWSMKWWSKLPFYATGADGQIAAYITCAALAVGAGFIAKQIPDQSQSALVLGSGSTRLLTSSSAPRYGNGSAVPRPPRRRRPTVRVTVTELGVHDGPTPQPDTAHVHDVAPAQMAPVVDTHPAPAVPAPTTAQRKLAALLEQRATGDPQ